MALDMRALYPIVLTVEENNPNAKEDVKANENCLNQNFTILAQKLAELETRLAALEGA